MLREVCVYKSFPFFFTCEMTTTLKDDKIHSREKKERGDVKSPSDDGARAGLYAYSQTGRLTPSSTTATLKEIQRLL